MNGSFNKMRRIMMAGMVCVSGAFFSGSLLAIPTSPDISPDNPVKTFGLMTRVLDGNNYIVKLYDEQFYEKLKSLAVGDDKRLSYFNDDEKEIHLTLPNINTPSATNADDALKTLRGMQIGASVRNFSEGDQAHVDCFGWHEDGRLVCGVLSMTESNQWMDIGAWLIYRGYSPYITANGNNPRHHNDYLRYIRRQQ